MPLAEVRRGAREEVLLQRIARLEAEAAGDGQAQLRMIADHHALQAKVLEHDGRRDADGSAAEDNARLARLRVRLLGCAPAHGEGLDEAGGLIGDSGVHGVQPPAPHRVGAQHVLGEPSEGARAGGVPLGVKGIGVDTLAHGEVRHLGADGDDPRHGLVAEFPAHVDFVSCAGAVQVHGHIGSADRGDQVLHEHIVRTRHGHRGVAHLDPFPAEVDRLPHG